MEVIVGFAQGASGNQSSRYYHQGEVFVEYGLYIKAAAGFGTVVFNELSNGVLPGYLYIPESLVTGGYETDTSMLGEKMGIHMVKRIMDLGFKEENFIYHSNENTPKYSQMLQDDGEADVVYSGPGWPAHLAFIDPVEDWFKPSQDVPASVLQLRENPTHIVMSENLAATIEDDDFFQY